WKELTWILHPENVGIADLKYYLPTMLNETANYDYIFTYQDKKLVNISSAPIEQTSTV
ncbi:DNA mismatch repair protein MutT, partial [Clostridioides difficile]|nr:DNA mismatch repair protein MutT [Clostridioides difficile]